jgi:signal transduction histidine kinase
MNALTCTEGRPATRRHRGTGRRRGTNREAELRSLMTMTSHDLRSPLTTIAAHLELLRDELGDHAAEDLAVMERAVRRMERLLDNLVDYARSTQNELRITTVALDQVVADVTADRVTTANRARVTVDGTLPEVQADAELLRHVIDNLIGNAIKYTARGATAALRVSSRTIDGEVRVEVADNGIGIPEADRPRVFDAFHRSANSGGYQGTGLGLAICRRIVERHGGRIGVTEAPAGGSLFWFTLPSRISTQPGGRRYL